MNPSRTILLCAILLTACATTTTGPWTIELTSTGGIHGRGSGGVFVDDAGTAVVTRPDGRRCELDGIGDTLERAVASAQPQRWEDSYESDCADCFEWTLTLTRGDDKYTTRWNDISETRPHDLARIDDALRALKNEHSEQCR